MNILLSGSSGLVGSHLSKFLSNKGYTVFSLVRSKTADPYTIFWDPSLKKIDLPQNIDFCAAIHLSGESIAKGFWTKAKKQKILDSRKQSTEFLVNALSSLENPPKLFLSASAVGYYGNSLELCDEKTPLGKGFLANVCKAWEEAGLSWRKPPPRVVQARFGMILSKKGGFLQAILPIFRLGLGAKIGSGKQKISWISLEDALRALHHILITETIKGPVNITAPYAVSQEGFADILAKVLNKPRFLFFPKWFFPGEKAEELLFSSTHALPTVLEKTGFSFLHPTLEKALRALL